MDIVDVKLNPPKFAKRVHKQLEKKIFVDPEHRFECSICHHVFEK